MLLPGTGKVLPTLYASSKTLHTSHELLSLSPSYTPYLRPWWTNLSEIWYIVDLILVPEPIKAFVKLVHQELSYGVIDGT